VRRDELYRDGSDGDDGMHDEQEDAGIRAKLNERLSRMLDLDLEPQISGDGGPEPMDQDEPELEFRLFSTSAPKVVLPDDDEFQGDGGILSARPTSFYLKDFTPEERERFREVAVSYADITQGARQRAWGLEVPWRVTKITLKSCSTSTVASQPGSKSKQQAGEDEEMGKRKRPGKKRRIALRIKDKERKEKERIRKEKEEANEKNRMTKEEHLREKKKRLNREKKLKRRQKEKEKKMAGKGEGGGDADADSSDSDDSQ
jgi:hypothetical protein